MSEPEVRKPPDQVEAAAPGTLCDICGGAPTPVERDYHPTTNEPRGWLCGSCNAGLGRFQEDVTLLESAAAYMHTWGD